MTHVRTAFGSSLLGTALLNGPNPPGKNLTHSTGDELAAGLSPSSEEDAEDGCGSSYGIVIIKTVSHKQEANELRYLIQGNALLALLPSFLSAKSLLWLWHFCQSPA